MIHDTKNRITIHNTFYELTIMLTTMSMLLDALHGPHSFIHLVVLQP